MFRFGACARCRGKLSQGRESRLGLAELHQGLIAPLFVQQSEGLIGLRQLVPRSQDRQLQVEQARFDQRQFLWLRAEPFVDQSAKGLRLISQLARVTLEGSASLLGELDFTLEQYLAAID